MGRAARCLPIGWLLLVGACSSELTELVVIVDSDLSVPGELDAVELTVEGPASTEREEASLGGGIALPLILFLEPGGSALEPVTVTAVGRLAGADVVDRSIRTSFVSGQRRVVRMFLARSCLGVDCGADQTCTENGCVGVQVPGIDLPTWTGEIPDAGPGGGGEDGAVEMDGGTDAGGDSGFDAGVDAAMFDGCVPVAETCDGTDEDCDGTADEDFDLMADTMNCGACGMDCGTPTNGTAICRRGTCGVRCDSGWGDCDMDASNGCEVMLGVLSDCASCGDACSGPAAACMAGACQYTVNITAIDDAYVDDSLPTMNFGSTTNLLVDGGPIVYETFIEPQSLAVIPSGSTIVSATLELDCFNRGDLAEAHRVTAAWSEGAITWATRPASEAAPFTTFTPAVGTAAVDLTVVMQEWVSGTTAPNGVRLRSSSILDGGGSDYRSTEYGTSSRRPRIVVTYR